MSRGSRKRRRSTEEIAELMAGYERSGLARREYCRRRGISVTAFDYYRHRWNRNRQLVPVEMAEAPVGGGGSITLVLAKRTTMPATLPELETERRKILLQFTGLGDLRKGSIGAVTRRCGKPTCHCARNDGPGHDPQVRLTTKVGGKTVAESFPSPAHGGKRSRKSMSTIASRS